MVPCNGLEALIKRHKCTHLKYMMIAVNSSITNFSINLGPVHTSAFSNVCVFVRPKTHRSIRVHTTVFVAYSTVHTKTLENADPIVVWRKAASYAYTAFALARNQAIEFKIFLVYKTDFLLELDPGTAQIKRVILELLFVFDRMKSSWCCIKQNLNANKQLRLPEA